MNTFIEELNKTNKFSYTENGARTRTTTDRSLYDLFAFGGSYRERSEEDCIFLFKKAFEEKPVLSLKCLFYLRDITDGQGERHFFVSCYKWLVENHSEYAKRNIMFIPSFGRWKDIFDIFCDTSLENFAFAFVAKQLTEDLHSDYPSLCAKWCPSENTSSKETKRIAKKFIKFLQITPKSYRKMLSLLRKKIDVLETHLSTKEWDKIDFSKVPSVAGLKYLNLFYTKPELSVRYKEYISNRETKVNTKALYPYQIVHKALNDETPNEALEKYWENLPNYIQNTEEKIMCVVDTSDSMNFNYFDSIIPIDVAISLGMYCSERLQGDFHNKYISFSSHPRFIKINGINFKDKVKRIYRKNLCENTNIKATFDLLKKACLKAKEEDRPTKIIIISDMEIDGYDYHIDLDDNTLMENIRKEWAAVGLKMPSLVYWNVNARHNNVLDDAKNTNVTYVSGYNTAIFKQIMEGKTGIEVMYDKLLSDRYKDIM